ncbi:hypothetical protein [Paludibaculum fermentans]|uniref:Uncharacterized protein n=1 Tax=Paludibaculum fermentans TaxID=1473598 RepID=A0A7S7SMA2_PALFE|nr:hypothetical protein [Paludibaculum fermentans]QOY89301.1 hypothetical protein IRI77_04915 [Paludibaculum fermentans]
MLVYPFLTTGAVAQYPMVRTARRKRVETVSPGGHVSRMLAGGPAEVTWRLEYAELSDSEAGAIEALYAAARGGLMAFTFVDPLANLLAASEDLTTGGWNRDALLNVSVTAPGEFALSNGSLAAQGVQQGVAMPAGAPCCLSAEVKGAGVTLSLGGVSRHFAAASGWRRIWVSGFGIGEGTAARLDVDGGGQAMVRGLQLEAQAAPSPYKPTYGPGGVYPQTRFATDGLEVSATGPNRNAVIVILKSKVAE